MAYSSNPISKNAVEILNRLSKWLLLLAIIWLCWGIARVLWLILAPPQAPNLPLLERQSKQRPMVNTNAALMIFASPEAKPSQAAKPPPQVQLAGVMLAEPSEMSSAMLEVDGIMQNYRIGEMLKGSTYKLIDVSWDQAIIADASDHQVVLDMPERMNLNQGLSANTRSGAISNRRLPNPNVNNNSPASESATVTPPTMGSAVMPGDPEEETGNAAPQNDNQKAQSAIDTAVDELKQNPATYLSSMGVMATGEGYQVTEAMPSKLRSRLGLESGDKVLSVNGQPVGANPAGDADLLSQVKQSGQAVIEVQRGEQTITIRQQF